MLKTESTPFTKDVLGRYFLNTFEEAKATDFRRFDVIVLGGGSFGAAIAEQLFQLDSKNKQHRVLVLEGGLFLLPEHVQNLPPMHAGLGSPPATTIEDQRIEYAKQNPGQPIPALLPPTYEVWGLPWHSRAAAPAIDPKDKKFPGLAFCVGGRSLFWGGWSPELIDSELAEWPKPVADALKAKYFAEAKSQLGTDVTNDFIFGPLHTALRDRLFAGLGGVANVVQPSKIEDVEAPLAVQSAHTRAGFFPFNKFSAVPLLMGAARQAESESPGNDFQKRLMIVPNCHVTKLLLDQKQRVSRIQTNLGDIDILPSTIVVLALGTIESTRLALLSFPNKNGLMGKNLMAHLRSNTTIRIPRSSFIGLPDELEASALFVKGRNGKGHFHLQITGCGVRGDISDAESELNKKIPDIDDLNRLKGALTGVKDDFVVVTLRGIGQMIGKKDFMAVSRIDLDPEVDENLVQRAIVTLGLTKADQDLWKLMDEAAVKVAQVLAGGASLEYLNPNGQWKSTPFTQRDGLGTTHHEAGTLWMGEDPATSVTDLFGRFHEVQNAFVVGPALFPASGSPNPMLGGIALIRRTAEHLIPPEVPVAVESDFVPLFDGGPITGWQMAGPGSFVKDNGFLRTEGGMGLFWYGQKKFKDFVLRLEYRESNIHDNSGVFVRFPDPGNDPLVAVDQGYEVQIDDLGEPDNSPVHRTGAIYGFAGPRMFPTRLVGEWNSLEIRVENHKYTVILNGQRVTEFTGNRSLEGYIGMQNHHPGSSVFFRNVRVKVL
jgi:choline dehydrogenase-like flavoprotein